jgi:hypothetical protein
MKPKYFTNHLTTICMNSTGCCVLLIVFVSSCTTLKESAKYQFTEGFYKTRLSGKTEKVYVLPGPDTIKVFPKVALSNKIIDTSKEVSFEFPIQKPEGFTQKSFKRNTFDMDVLTVLFKYRPATEGFPPQFNATFNGAVYIGYRTDVYHLKYRSTPLHTYKRNITHYGYSIGLFTGLGTARIDEYVTNNALHIQYDGLVNLSGVAVILAIDKLTAGLSFGVDHLLDRNHSLWVNNGKIWIGLSVGLNLN